jgi:hypothetical protein
MRPDRGRFGRRLGEGDAGGDKNLGRIVHVLFDQLLLVPLHMPQQHHGPRFL